LVVIAIIAILAAMLLPVLARPRPGRKPSNAFNNSKQFIVPGGFTPTTIATVCLVLAMFSFLTGRPGSVETRIQ